MSTSLFLLCAAAGAVVAFSTSAACALVLASLRRRLEALAAAAQARLLFGVALLPALTCVAVMTAALAPSLAGGMDHCAERLMGHNHAHLCVDHPVQALPAWTLIVLALAMLTHLFVRVTRSIRDAARAALTGHALSRRAMSRGDIRVIPLREPHAFVLGSLAPRIYVTDGLLAPSHRQHLDAVLAHERAHLRRRDPLRRLAASLALGFHLPGIAGWLERRLSCAHEMAADAAAADELANPESVALALVRLTRPRRDELALAFGASNIEARVAMLLDRRPRRDGPHRAVLLAGAVALVALVGAGADSVHHGVEHVLDLLS